MSGAGGSAHLATPANLRDEITPNHECGVFDRRTAVPRDQACAFEDCGSGLRGLAVEAREPSGAAQQQASEHQNIRRDPQAAHRLSSKRKRAAELFTAEQFGGPDNAKAI